MAVSVESRWLEDYLRVTPAHRRPVVAKLAERYGAAALQEAVIDCEISSKRVTMNRLAVRLQQMELDNPDLVCPLCDGCGMVDAEPGFVDFCDCR